MARVKEARTHTHNIDAKLTSRASFRRWSSLHVSDPTAPSAGVGKNVMSASSIKRTAAHSVMRVHVACNHRGDALPHAGHQYSGWCADMLKHTLCFTLNRPLG